MKSIIRSGIGIMAMLAISALILQNCSGSSFMSGSATKSKATDTSTNPDGTGTSGTGNTGVNSGNVAGGAGGAGTPVVPGSSTTDVPVPEPLKEKIGGLSDEQFNASTLVKDFLTSTQDNFYIVTMAGKAYYYTLQGATSPSIDDAKIVAKKMWTFPVGGAGGNRTYVTEGGLVFVRGGGRVHWIDPLKTPEGPLDMTPGGANFFQIAGVGDSFRGCPVSYKIGEQRLVGVGYELGKFAIFTQGTVPPYKPDWTTLDAKYTVNIVNTSNVWGYNCFIDQTKLIYYGAWAKGGENAFDLTAKKQVTVAASAPNAALVNLTEGSGAYASNGDRKGNVYNMATYYAFAGDAGGTATWATVYGESNIHVYPLSCMETGAGCDANYTYDATPLGITSGFLGPMSALPSTGVIIAQRTGGGIYFARLKDKANLASGIDVKKLDVVDGDPYMYNDYTGATLYADNSLVSYDLGAAASFDKNSALAVLIITWEAVDGQPTAWQDLELDIRCYKDGDFPPNFASVTGMNDAGMRTFVQVGSCRNTAANKVDLQVKQLNNANTIGRIKDFKVNFYQGN